MPLSRSNDESRNISRMYGIEHFWLFVAAAITLNLTPGQDTMYIIGRSLAGGRSAGVWSALGISTGSIVHTCAAAFGLSAVLAASATAFEIVKWAGALYLMVLGFRMLFEKTQHEIGNCDPNERRLTAYRQGILTNVLNPKVAIFFLAFLPQFVVSGTPNTVTPLLLLGCTFVLTGTLWCLMLAFAASAFTKRIRRNPRRLTQVRRLSGALFVGLGLRLAFTRAGAAA